VLNKEINFNQESDVNWYKNIDFSIIYHTSIKSSDSSFMSFCRKNIVEDAIIKFQKNNFQVADIYIGPFLSAIINTTLKKERLFSNDLILEFENEKLAGYKKQDEPFSTEEYAIGKDLVSSNFLVLYSVVIHFFLQSKEVVKTKCETLNIEEIFYRKAFQYLGKITLIGFFAALLMSYFLIQYYGSKNAALNLQNVYSSQSYENLLNFEQQKNEKQRILNESGLLSTRFLSNYAYDIIRSIPASIVLNEVNIIPIDKETKANKKISFKTKTILVKGETFNEASFNSWMGSLKKMIWLKDFEIISFKKDKKDKSQFEIKISIKDV
jgi:hypothetical protein